MAPSKEKSSGETEAPASGPAAAEAPGEGEKLSSIEDVLAICRDTRTLSREDYPARTATIKKVKAFLDARRSPLDAGDAEALSEAFGALRYTPTRGARAPEGDDDPLQQLVQSRRDRDQAWDDLIQSLSGKPR